MSPGAASVALVVALVPVSIVVNVGLLIAIALRRWWAVMVTIVFAVLGLGTILTGLTLGHPARAAWDTLLLALTAAAVALLLMPTSREWFATRDIVTTPPAAWYADPTGRYEHRYWDGLQWTPYVAARGQRALDTLAAPSEGRSPLP